MTSRSSLPPSYFDELYAQQTDPWRFATSDYERAKYDATLAAITGLHANSILEVGCSIGVLTRRLAMQCEELLAIDIAAAPLAEAQARCSDLKHVAFARMQVPQQWPEGRFDLILLSEMLYYLTPDDITDLAQKSRATLTTGGAIVLVHYIKPTNYPCTGDEAAEIFVRACDVSPTFKTRTEDYRLDLLQPT